MHLENFHLLTYEVKRLGLSYHLLSSLLFSLSLSNISLKEGLFNFGLSSFFGPSGSVVSGCWSTMTGFIGFNRLIPSSSKASIVSRNVLRSLVSAPTGLLFSNSMYLSTNF